MYRETCLVLLFGIIISILQQGHGLECWKCASEHDVRCRDYFNTTRIKESKRQFENFNYGNREIQPVRTEPHVETCDERFTQQYNQKNVCLKFVRKGTNGPLSVRRECRLVPEKFKVGDCPEDITGNQQDIEFCGTCDTNKCNAAGDFRSSIFFVTSISASLLLLLRK